MTDDGSGHPDMRLNLMNARVIALVAGERKRWALAGDIAGDRTPVIKTVFSNWAEQDSGAASGWIDSLPADDPDRDGLIGTLVGALVRQENHAEALRRFDQLPQSVQERWRPMLKIDQIKP